MALKKCLLVTDDPDDHQSFTDAVSENPQKAVVLVILDSQRAHEFLEEGLLIPDYIFLDLSMNGMRINSFLKSLRKNETLRSVPKVVYGEESNFSSIDDASDLIFFNKEYNYSELKTFLSRFFNSA